MRAEIYQGGVTRHSSTKKFIKILKKLAKILIGADVQRTRRQADMSSFIENPYLFT
jgi:hypothetical protein